MGAKASIDRNRGIGDSDEEGLTRLKWDGIVEIRKEGESTEELSVHFGYHCQSGHGFSGNLKSASIPVDPFSEMNSVEDGFSVTIRNGFRSARMSSSFSSLSGAALGANATLANSSICNGRLGEEILPGLDSPKAFRKMDSLYRTSSPKSDLSSLTVLNNACSSGSQSVPTQLGNLASCAASLSSESSSSFLNARDVQMAGGAAGEDRVQAVCSEDKGWLFCGIYDGFNGRDAADFLAGTLYENVGLHLRLLEHEAQKRQGLFGVDDTNPETEDATMDDLFVAQHVTITSRSADSDMNSAMDDFTELDGSRNESSDLPQFRQDARERERVISEHPEDPWAIANGRLKGKLRVTRAFGAGYLKRTVMNNTLMGILRVKDLSSPPYLTISPSTNKLQVQPKDKFVIIGSDGLFDFFTNEEVVEYVNSFLIAQPTGDPAKYMVEQLLLRAANFAGMPVHQLKSIPIGRRRKFHDDVTIIVVDLRTEISAAKASSSS